MREQETMAASQDTEITLGSGKLLGLFFTLVVLCGISLAVGYSLGRNSAKSSAPPAVATPNASAPAPSATPKPGAAQLSPQTPPTKSSDCAGENCAAQTTAPAPTDLTFYQAVQEKDSHPQLAPEPGTHDAASAPAPRVAAEGRTALGNGYVVQIAAVRNQDDARLLSETLRRQQYPVMINQPGDNLFHVQVGPYADMKEAEAIRSRLVGAGYNPFIKH
jgi:cell division septation protein DedD